MGCSRFASGLLLALLLLTVSACVCAVAATASANGQPAQVREIVIDGPVGPATAHYVQHQIAVAQADAAELVLLRIDTPGGLSRSTRKIVQSILGSPVPVVGYVAPRGARAASAGTYILYATHIAAMAPATHLGAATPVSLGASPAPASANGGDDTDKNNADDSSGNQASDQSGAAAKPSDESSDAALRRKIVNDAVAFIRSLANQHGRNADWAEKAVRQAATLTAKQALDRNVINLIAPSRAALLTQVDGMQVNTASGPVTLHTTHVQVVTAEPDWQAELLGVITHPAVAYILMLIGIFGLLFEGLNPGAILPGVLGGICLLVALYAFQILPINYAGLGLILLGVVLMVGEMFMPSVGVLGIGGVASFTFGSVMLMDTTVPGYGLPLGIIIGLAIAASSLILLIVWLFSRSRRQRVRTGSQGLIGSRCLAMADFDGTGRVWLHGEAWQARCDVPVHKNDVLAVVAAEGLTVHVQPESGCPG